jgi:hypothetical protein
MIYYGLKMDVVRFATALQLHFGKDLQLTTITSLGSSEVYCVSIVTDTLSEDIVKKEAVNFSLQLTNIWSGSTTGGKSPRK